MPIEMPRGLPFSVDTWTPNSKMKRHHFLTHAHKDHSASIVTHSCYPIYSTHLTKSLLLQHYPQLQESLFVQIEVFQTIFVDDPHGKFRVTAFEANHCPGAVMFLFEGNFGNILHTGDCRLTPECIRCLPEKYISVKGKQPMCQLDYIFLDCTFGKFREKFPSKHSAIQQVINCIWKHPSAAIVYLTCDLLGHEDILSVVSKTFGSKIFVDKAAHPECFQALTLVVPEIVTQDTSCRFHIFGGFPKLSERAAEKLAEAQANLQPEPLIIRPSAQWYACAEEDSETKSRKRVRVNEAVKDEFGVWHVCYSMHSSRAELEHALQLLLPKHVVSTTPNCWAVELDYVKKHCFGREVLSDDPMWKLLDISCEVSSVAAAAVSPRGISFFPVVEGPSQVHMKSQPQPLEVFSSQILSLSPPRKRPAVTLFGRARLSIEDSSFSTGGKAAASLNDRSAIILLDEIDQEEPSQKDIEEACENKLENVQKIDDSPVQCQKSVKKEVQKVSCSTIGSSKIFSGALRNLYRSMNVPVPRPLPSLVELARKGTKRRVEISSEQLL